jgi:MraZ protein
VFRGCHTARIDDKGRLKLPAQFKALVEEHFGTALYVTSYEDHSVRIYPLPTWKAIEERILKMPSTNRTRSKFLDRVGYFGQSTEFDSQGRFSITQRLRDLANLSGDLAVVGKTDYLEVHHNDRLKAKVTDDPLNDGDFKELEGYGV